MEYPLLRALAAEWNDTLRGARISAAFSQEKDELSLALEAPAGACTLRVRCSPANQLVWRSEGAGRARRNTASVLAAIHGREVSSVRVADRDRHLYLDLDGGDRLQMLLFGPRANVLVVGEDGMVQAAFLRDAEWRGRPAPAPRPAPWPGTAAVFRAAWPGGSTVATALARAMPSLGRTHATEVARRVGLDPDAPADLADDALDRLFDATLALEAEVVRRPHPHVYYRGRVPVAVSLVEPTGPPEGVAAKSFPTVDEAARAFAVGSLASEGFVTRYRPLEAALTATAARLARRAGAMAAELSRESRSDRHERDAHLLMAQCGGQGPGHQRVILPDILYAGPGPVPDVEIALDPSLSAVENAERLYARAREIRRARSNAEARWDETANQAALAAALVEEMRAMVGGPSSIKVLEAWRADRAPELARFLRGDSADEPRLPYRRFELPGGWEVRVGKSARDNAELTARHAGPYDLWLHARGVSGSHVVLRRPARTAVPGRDVVEAAAALAAYYSRARNQSMVPVIVTERKYVRPVKGGAPGLVRVEREEVVMVEPKGMG